MRLSPLLYNFLHFVNFNINFLTRFSLMRFSRRCDDVHVGSEGRCAGLGSTRLALGGATFRDAQIGEESG